MSSKKKTPRPAALPPSFGSSTSMRPLPPGSPSYHTPFVSPAGVKVTYEGEWAKQHHLDCDGLCLPFYQMLHKKLVSRDTYEEPACIPETVVFEHNFPQAWFSYEEENKELIKRPGKMLDAATMYEYFSTPCPGAGGVVAQFFHVSVPFESVWKSILSPNEVYQQGYAGQYITYVEFFTATTLSKFLFGQHRKPNGVLQRFVLPKGQGMSRKNMQIEVLWTPAITTARMRVNRRSLENRTVPLADRLATYDGAPHLSDELTVADETKNSLTSICQQIVEHFHRTEKKWISRLLLYFKADDKNNLWLLWCGGVRTEGNALNPNFLLAPLMPHMRKEIISAEEATTSVDRLEQRRQQQKRLLALDYEFFHVTKDIQFAVNVNGTHRRQARELGLRGLQNVKFEEGSIDPRKNPNHPLHEAFIRVCSEKDDICAPYTVGHFSALRSPYKKGNQKSTSSPRSGKYRDTSPSGEQDGYDGGYTGEEEEEERSLGSPYEEKRMGSGAMGGRAALLPPEWGGGEGGEAPTTEMVQKELIALAMDAWYSMYSSTLSPYPAVMPTTTMELAPPIAVGGVLTPKELERLTEILGIHSIHEEGVGGSPMQLRIEKKEQKAKEGVVGRHLHRGSLGMSRLSPFLEEEQGTSSATSSPRHRASIYHPETEPSPLARGGGERRSSTSSGSRGGSSPMRAHTGADPTDALGSSKELALHPMDIYRADPGVLSNARRLDRPSAQVEAELVVFFTSLFQRRGGDVWRACMKRFPSFFDLL